MLTRFCVLAVCLLATPLSALAERAVVQVTPGEYRRLGYQDKDVFMDLYSRCVQVSKDLKLRGACADDECVKKSKPWQEGGCDKHATTMYYLTSIDPPRYPVSEIFDNTERASYVRLYTGSCQDGYKAMNPGGDAALVKNTCECAANQSLDLIEYSDYKAFESPNASQEVVARVKNRAAYARFICENKPAVWREQSAEIGATAAGRDRTEAAAVDARANAADARLIGLFDQLQAQGTALYASLLAKLTAEAKDKSCQGDPLCNRINDTFGAIYKDVLYTAHATQIYKTAGETGRPLARARLHDFVKVALVSIDANVKFLRSALPGSKGGDPLLVKTLRDAEQCQKQLTTISRELEKR